MVLGQRGGLRKLDSGLANPTFAWQALCLRLAVIKCHARGAIDAGISASYAYPGTPSTEIFQTLQTQAKALGLPNVPRCVAIQERIRLPADGEGAAPKA